MKYILKLTFFSLFFPLIFFTACNKQSQQQKNKQLAKDHYKMCMLEFSDKSDVNSSSNQVYKKSLMHIQQAINYDPNPEYLAIKATILFRLGAYQESKQTFELALKNNPEPQLRTNILNNYACILHQLGNSKDAIKIFSKLENDNYYLTPQAAIFNKGKIYFEQDNFKAAEKEFSKAIFHAPDFLDARYFLALSALKLNNLALVKNEISTILFLDPEHAAAKNLSEKLKAEQATQTVQ